MKHQRKSRHAAAHIQTALEASCGALITLESIRARAGDEATEDLRRPIQQAIESLRQAIAELRSASGRGDETAPGRICVASGRSRARRAAALCEPAADGVDRCLHPARKAELREDVRDVILGRPRTYVEGLGDLRVLEPASNQAQHVEFSRR